MTLATFITALGIRNVGEEVAEIYAQTFSGLGLLMSASRERLLSIHGVGEQIAESTYEYFKASRSQREIDKMLEFIEISAPEKPQEDQKFTDTSFVITGSFQSFSRDEIKKIIKEKGGKVMSQISSKTNYLIAGEKAGSKLVKAKDLNITILDEIQFHKEFLL
jgi:DNA ligase (NAD+)